MLSDFFKKISHIIILKFTKFKELNLQSSHAESSGSQQIIEVKQQWTCSVGDNCKRPKACVPKQSLLNSNK